MSVKNFWLTLDVEILVSHIFIKLLSRKLMYYRKMLGKRHRLILSKVLLSLFDIVGDKPAEPFFLALLNVQGLPV